MREDSTYLSIEIMEKIINMMSFFELNRFSLYFFLCLSLLYNPPHD